MEDSVLLIAIISPFCTSVYESKKPTTFRFNFLIIRNFMRKVNSICVNIFRMLISSSK